MTGQRRSEGGYRRAWSGPLRGSAALTGLVGLTDCAGMAVGTPPFSRTPYTAWLLAAFHLGDGGAP
eukprot:15214187-Alexandrium_andersonii.AAC.1